MNNIKEWVEYGVRGLLRSGPMKSIGWLILVLPIAPGNSFAWDETVTLLPETEITASRIKTEPAERFSTELSGEALRQRQLYTGDSAGLLETIPGVSRYGAGGVSSLPVIDGLADDRLRLLVDGMDITSACPNHMNPALSYIAPSAVARVQVLAGISPVSLGGDSIGGTIIMQSTDPEFTHPGEGIRTSGQLSSFYRSNGDARGLNLFTALVSENFSLAYTGSTVEANNYKDGNGHAVRSTAYRSDNHLLSLGTKFGSHLLGLNLGWQQIPYQGYPNQYMDMTSNKSFSFNLRYKGDFDWGNLEARTYRQRVRHKMDMLEDKANLGVLTYGTPYAMPMDTRAVDSGYSIKADIPLDAKDLVRVGHEYHHYTLDDWWPPLEGSMMMGPETFWNINDGKRDRLALYGEWERKWKSAWMTQLGVRYERVTMNTGPVQGYYSTGDDMGMGMGLPDGFTYQNDADAFNAQNHKKTDHNIDWTAVARYEASPNATYDVGVARKTRSPNLYERFAWSNEASMAGAMVSWFGDLNAYVGNLNLKPEVAHTLRATADWHDSERKDWSVQVTPFYTRVNDYINVEPNLATTWPAPKGRAALRFVNHDAELYGLNAEAQKFLGRAAGEWNGHLSLSYVRGKDLENDTGLYNIMPLNARLSVDHRLGEWTNTLEGVAVGSKNHVDNVRLEQKTSGYALVNFRTSYRFGRLRVDAGIDNLFDQRYDLPLGGIDFYKYNYLSEATGGYIAPVAGMGRSVSMGLSLDF